jgi:hypothetical protein
VHWVDALGGDPGAAAGADWTAWAATIREQPVPVSWTSGAVDQVLMQTDPKLAAAFQEAIKAYVAAQQKAWDAADICPYTCNGLGTCDAKAHTDHCACTEHAIGRGCSHCGYGWTKPITDGTGKFDGMGDHKWDVDPSTPGFDSPLGQIFDGDGEAKCAQRCKWSTYWAMEGPGFGKGISRCYCLGTTTLDELESNSTSTLRGGTTLLVSARKNKPPTKGKLRTCNQPVCNPRCYHGGQCVGENKCACPKCAADGKALCAGLSKKPMTTGSHCDACASGWGPTGNTGNSGAPSDACYCHVGTKWC